MIKRSANSDRRPRRGFTLMEMMIVALLTGLVAMITAQFWRFFATERQDMTHRILASQELAVALEGITTDIGAAVGASVLADDRILLCKDAGPTPDGEADWGAPDVLVEYTLNEGKLFREEGASGTSIAIADGVTAFEIDDAGEDVYDITVAVQFGEVERMATIHWSYGL